MPNQRHRPAIAAPEEVNKLCRHSPARHAPARGSVIRAKVRRLSSSSAHAATSLIISTRIEVRREVVRAGIDDAQKARYAYAAFIKSARRRRAISIIMLAIEKRGM